MIEFHLVKRLLPSIFILMGFLSYGQETDQASEIEAYNYLIVKNKDAEVVSLKGRILDQNEQGIPFANIGIRGTLFGTAADEDGYFQFNLPKSSIKDSVTISCVGYQSMEVSAEKLKSTYQFMLSEDIANLSAIEIESERITALDVMRKVIKRIPDNYFQEAYTQRKVQRMKAIVKGEYCFVEKVHDDYDDTGYKATAMYGLGKVKSFSTVHQCRIGKLDTLTGKVYSYEHYPRVWATHTGWSDVVDASNNNFLSKSKHSKYDFQFNERGLYSADTIFIDFNIDRPSHRNTTSLEPLKFSGTILINAHDYAVLEVHTTNVLDKEKLLSSKVYKPYRGNTEKIWYSKEIVRYKKIDGYYFFSSLQRLSNWDLDTNGFVEIIGLDILKGEREKQDFQLVPKEAYDTVKWEKLATETLK